MSNGLKPGGVDTLTISCLECVNFGYIRIGDSVEGGVFPFCSRDFEESPTIVFIKSPDTYYCDLFKSSGVVH